MRITYKFRFLCPFDPVCLRVPIYPQKNKIQLFYHFRDSRGSKKHKNIIKVSKTLMKIRFITKYFYNL